VSFVCGFTADGIPAVEAAARFVEEDDLEVGREEEVPEEAL
jgi:hypothetical protein